MPNAHVANYTNLAKLALYMRDTYGDKHSDPHFSMEMYQVCDDLDVYQSACDIVVVNIPHHCETVCCLAGHGPAAGFPPQPQETWDNYVTRVFVDTESHTFLWLFGASWPDDIQDAIARLAWFLQGNDIPHDSTMGQLDDGFTPDWKYIETLAQQPTQQ